MRQVVGRWKVKKRSKTKEDRSAGLNLILWDSEVGTPELR
jgi:hypothetical protein